MHVWLRCQGANESYCPIVPHFLVARLPESVVRDLLRPISILSSKRLEFAVLHTLAYPVRR